MDAFVALWSNSQPVDYGKILPINQLYLLGKPNTQSMRLLFTFSFLLTSILAIGQTATIKGQLQDDEAQAVPFANVILYAAADSSMIKVEPTNEAGIFQIQNLPAGNYFLKASYVGYADISKPKMALAEGEVMDLGVLSFGTTAVNLEGATVTARRALVEVKPDRTVFNVQGTINAVGENGIALLRKAPGVIVDNNDNISVLGRSGVLVYIDGKRLPLTGTELSNYLNSLTAAQIDRIDIITNPGAKYEAQGNAGIIDIRLKKDKNLGTNGSVSGTFSQGRYSTYNGTASGNYRNKKMNIFASAGAGGGESFNDMVFKTEQNGFFVDEINETINDNLDMNYRVGADFFLTDKSTFGVLASGNTNALENESLNRLKLSNLDTKFDVDSILVAENSALANMFNQTYNMNYSYDSRKGRSLNIDLDYGSFATSSDRNQPNRYYYSEGDIVANNIATERIIDFETATDIDIYTGKIDFEEEIFGGKLGLGTKYSKVVSENDFLVFDVEGTDRVRNDDQSNIFLYDESVYAGYVNFARAINQKWNFSAGLRAEQTDAEGELTAFNNMASDSTVDLHYLQWFPSAGLTFQAAPMHAFALNYGRRINRPDYNVLNPFENRMSELSYEKGNPRLNPEIVNNFEIGYTYAYRYNVKLSYSKTTDQITRLISADEEDPRAGFITWANLAEQTIYNLNVSLPFQFTKWWNGYFNLSGGYQDNQAEYDTGFSVDVQAWTYNIYQQQTFTLPKGFVAECSGYFAGPGVWGGVFEYDETFAIGLGLQKRFLNDQLNIRMAVTDIFYESGWAGVSEFGGAKSEGNGNWDSRRFTISANYNFGNQNVKSRKRKVGIEEEAGRVN
ncbi:MAG: TonB-dependent receptor [Saprospiraceae bacterium]